MKYNLNFFGDTTINRMYVVQNDVETKSNGGADDDMWCNGGLLKETTGQV